MVGVSGQQRSWSSAPERASHQGYLWLGGSFTGNAVLEGSSFVVARSVLKCLLMTGVVCLVWHAGGVRAGGVSNAGLIPAHRGGFSRSCQG